MRHLLTHENKLIFHEEMGDPRDSHETLMRRRDSHEMLMRLS